jgi:hypothetical protein
VEPVDIDTPRGALDAVARLTVDPVDLELWFDLRFTPVEDDLSPSVLALARLADGTLVGFAQSESDRGSANVVQYAEREPRDVLIQLLYETGLTHEQVSWIAGPRGVHDPRMWARTFSEAYLYFLMHAGKEYTDEEVLGGVQSSLVGDDTVMRFAAIELWVPPRQGWAPPDKPTYSDPEDPPSTIIDAGLWVSIANSSANTGVELLNEYGSGPIDDNLYAEIEENIVRAASAFDESLKFVPPGADMIPVTACWSARGLQNYRETPEAFRRETLERLGAEYRQAIGTFRRRYGSARG